MTEASYRVDGEQKCAGTALVIYSLILTTPVINSPELRTPHPPYPPDAKPYCNELLLMAFFGVSFTRIVYNFSQKVPMPAGS